MSKKVFMPIERIEKSILLIRGQKVMLDSCLAELYGVETRALNQAVKRNIDRFPKDFMFQLTPDEAKALRSQFVTLKRNTETFSKRGGHRKYLPYVFTEQGVAMLSSVLQSKRAVQVNIQIMRVFVQFRTMIASNTKLARKLEELEKRMGTQDIKIKAIFDAIKQLMALPEKKSNPIGFKPNEN